MTHIFYIFNLDFSACSSASRVKLSCALSHHDCCSWRARHIFITRFFCLKTSAIQFLKGVEGLEFSLRSFCASASRGQGGGGRWFALRFLSHVNPLRRLSHSQLTQTDAEMGEARSSQNTVTHSIKQNRKKEKKKKDFKYFNLIIAKVFDDCAAITAHEVILLHTLLIVHRAQALPVCVLSFHYFYVRVMVFKAPSVRSD